MGKKKTEPDLVAFVTDADVQVVIRRIPEKYRLRLRDVFINDHSFGVRWLGAVVTRGRRDIDLYAVLPYRVSLGRFLNKWQNASEFGAPARGQWPPWAVRRFFLYGVFLHELGHLQLVNPKSRHMDRKYASEKLAQEFADSWRKKLWSSYFQHPDPIHNKPEPDELSIIPLWQNLDKKQRFMLVDIALKAPHETMPDLTPLGDINDSQMKFLTRALCHI
jgi:hypothetical protein